MLYICLAQEWHLTPNLQGQVGSESGQSRAQASSGSHAQRGLWSSALFVSLFVFCWLLVNLLYWRLVFCLWLQGLCCGSTWSALLREVLLLCPLCLLLWWVGPLVFYLLVPQVSAWTSFQSSVSFLSVNPSDQYIFTFDLGFRVSMWTSFLSSLSLSAHLYKL